MGVHRFTGADALLLATVGIWGVNFAVVKFALAELPPLAFNAVRFLAAGVALALMMRLMRLYGALRVTGICTLAGAVPLVLLGLPELAALERPVSAGAWTAAILSGFFAIGLVYFFWHYGVSRLGSTRTALYTNLTPPIALLTAWLALGETLTAQQGLGTVLAIVGVALARRYARPRESTNR